jgi:hypothetical protein
MLNRKRAIVWMTTMATVVGCETGSPTDTGEFADPPAATVGGGVVASASGAAHREAGGLPVLLNFSARLHADGSASGSYYYHAVTDHTWIHVNVTCMTIVDGNRAFIAGVIRDSSIPVLIGTISYFYTRDNGEGADADPDEVSLVRANDVAGADEEFCTELPTVLPNREVLHGNVQVRG